MCGDQACFKTLLKKHVSGTTFHKQVSPCMASFRCCLFWKLPLNMCKWNLPPTGAWSWTPIFFFFLNVKGLETCQSWPCTMHCRKLRLNWSASLWTVCLELAEKQGMIQMQVDSGSNAYYCNYRVVLASPFCYSIIGCTSSTASETASTSERDDQVPMTQRQRFTLATLYLGFFCVGSFYSILDPSFLRR